MAEEWRPVPGFEGRYDVSNQGRVRSWLPCRGVSLPYLRKLSLGTTGYLVIMMSDAAGVAHPKKVHQLVAAAFIGPRPPRHDVRHLDGDRTNNSATNLAYGTRSENEMDKIRHGRHNMASRTHCKHGHEFTPENTAHWGGKKHRVCRRCHAIQRKSETKAAREAARLLSEGIAS